MFLYKLTSYSLHGNSSNTIVVAESKAQAINQSGISRKRRIDATVLCDLGDIINPELMIKSIRECTLSKVRYAIKGVS